MKPHPNPYPLGWVCEDSNLNVTHQCNLKFAIPIGFVDEVVLDVVSLNICGIVLGSPYLFDIKVIFFREHNMYHFFKNMIKYTLRAHKMINDLSIVAIK